jgi:hypothetical protein
MVNELNKSYGVFNSEPLRTFPIDINNYLKNDASLNFTQSKSSPDLSQAIGNTYKNSTTNTLNTKISIEVSPASSNTNQSFNHINSNFLHSQIKSKITIYHQNICGLRKTTNEILCHFPSELPHIRGWIKKFVD